MSHTPVRKAKRCGPGFSERMVIVVASGCLAAARPCALAQSTPRIAASIRPGTAAASASGSTAASSTSAGAQPSLGAGIVLRTGVFPDGLDLFGELRLRLEVRPARGFGEIRASDPSDLLVRFRPGIFWRQKDDSILIQGQGALTDPLNNPSDPNSKHLEFHQLFYNRSGLLSGNLDVRVGRQELAYGEERLIGAVNWTNTGRTFDGVRTVLGHPGLTLDAFYAHTVNFQSPQPLFYLGGVYGSRTSPEWGTADLYLLTKTNDGGKALNRYTAGGRWKRIMGPIFGLSLEGAGQGGTEAPAPGAPGVSVGAYAGHVAVTENLQATWAFRNAPRSLTLVEEVNYATGTGKATRVGGTFDNLFATNHDKYGYMDYQSWRNMKELRLGLSAQPTKTVSASADYHRFGLASAHDFWYNAAGAPMLPAQKRAIDYGTDTGSEVDLTATYKQSARAVWYGGVSQFYPGSFQKRVQGKAASSTWLFLQTTLTY